MSSFSITWMTRAQLPAFPPQMSFSAANPASTKPDDQARTPVIRWGRSLACVLESRNHHDQAWVVVYGDGKQLTGVHPLHDFRHISRIQLAANSHAVLLTDSAQRQQTVEFTQLKALDGSGGAGNNVNGLPSGIPFMLTNGHDYLMADEGGVYLAVNPDPKAMQWIYKDGQLVNVTTGQALGLGICGKVSAASGDRWRLSSKGELLYGDGSRTLCGAPTSGEVWLQRRSEALPSEAWRVQLPQLPRRGQVPSMVIDKLSLCLAVSADYSAGTGDTLSFSINGSEHRQPLAGNFERGAHFKVEVDLVKMFQRSVIYADELHTVEIYQASTGGYGPAWKMQSLDLKVNDQLSNRVVGSDNRWIEARDGVAWQGRVNWLDWRKADISAPLDFAGYTYPVQLQQWLIDVLKWRSYKPETIDGVCQLIGEDRGQILAYELKSGRLIYLRPNTAQDAYTWVYTPQKSILVKFWDQSLDRTSYTRHSQLGGGQAVVCAGEMRIERKTTSSAVSDILGLVNDASGHYKPDGGQCLGHVLERLEQLGLDTAHTVVSYKG